MTISEKTVFFGSFLVVWGAPLLSLLIGFQLFLLTVYVLTTGAFFVTLKKYMCSCCMNFACPLNGVEEETRRQFFAKNPSVAVAWGVPVDETAGE